MKQQWWLWVCILVVSARCPYAVTRPDEPAPLACWPWPKAVQETIHPGVTHWVCRSTPDGTMAHLVEFNFADNPRLRLELYDQDEDDAVPFDNKTAFWSMGIGQATRHLNAGGRGKVIAVWNGLFFTANAYGKNGTASHIGPVVLNGTVYHNVGNYRWTFGVQYLDGKPVFKTLHLPNRSTLAQEFTYAASCAQCLISDGKPLLIPSYPKVTATLPKPPVPSTPQDAGYIPDIDHLHTSRTSMGWSQDQQRFYLLIIREPDNEMTSMRAFSQRQPDFGGWMLADLQRFWQAFGVWGAVNIDGGLVTQCTLLRQDGNYLLLPPDWISTTEEIVYAPAFERAPEGGTLMYFFIRDSGDA